MDQALKTWSRDLRENKGGLKGKRAPAYGFPIDLLLLQEVKERMQMNLPVDDVTLHTLLVHQLQVHNRLELMTENGGSHLFLHGWAGRFWKRHNLPSRLTSAKEQKLGKNAVNNGNCNTGNDSNGSNGSKVGEIESAKSEINDKQPVSAAVHLIELHTGAQKSNHENEGSQIVRKIENEKCVKSLKSQEDSDSDDEAAQ